MTFQSLLKPIGVKMWHFLDEQLKFVKVEINIMNWDVPTVKLSKYPSIYYHHPMGK